MTAEATCPHPPEVRERPPPRDLRCRTPAPILPRHNFAGLSEFKNRLEFAFRVDPAPPVGDEHTEPTREDLTLGEVVSTPPERLTDPVVDVLIVDEHCDACGHRRDDEPRHSGPEPERREGLVSEHRQEASGSASGSGEAASSPAPPPRTTSEGGDRDDRRRGR